MLRAVSGVSLRPVLAGRPIALYTRANAGARHGSGQIETAFGSAAIEGFTSREAIQACLLSHRRRFWVLSRQPLHLNSPATGGQTPLLAPLLDRKSVV